MASARRAAVRVVDRRGRKPELTHATGERFARLVDGLHVRPEGWPLEAIARELDVSDKTLDRYLRKCGEALTDEQGRPRLEIVRRGGRRLARLAPRGGRLDAGVFQTATLQLARTVLRFLGGTTLESGLSDVWERCLASLPEAQRERLTHLDRKLVSIAFAEKEYRQHDDTIDAILRALVFERRLRVDYRGRHGEGRIHPFDPYTLAVHRGGLYLIGFSHTYDKVITLAVERIRRATLLDEHFAYPAAWNPRKHRRRVFGLMSGDEASVVVRIRDADVETLIRARRLGLDERFESEPDGTTLMRCRVRGTAELASWLRSFGSAVEVLEPAALRAEMAAEARALAARYADTPAPAAVASAG
jgi:predicted DNA-binding transcriptional regulator YafY